MAVDRGAIFRACRWLHGYLSAFAFLALIFFSATGLVLNHPEWTRSVRPSETARTVMVDPADLAAALTRRDPGPALAKAVEARTPLVGRLKSADVVEDQAFLRLEGPKGFSDVVIDLKSGQTEIGLNRSSAVTLLDELHKGRDAGPAWKAFIDLSAIVFLALSIVGYVLFFSLRFRLRSSLVVTGVSLALMVGLVWLLVR